MSIFSIPPLPRSICAFCIMPHPRCIMSLSSPLHQCCTRVAFAAVEAAAAAAAAARRLFSLCAHASMQAHGILRHWDTHSAAAAAAAATAAACRSFSLCAHASMQAHGILRQWSTLSAAAAAAALRLHSSTACAPMQACMHTRCCTN